MAETKSRDTQAARNIRIADKNHSEYLRYRDASEHNKYIQRAKIQDRYYRGDQWDESDRSELEAAGRPALTINLCLNKVNTVIGEQIAKRVDVSFKPKGNGATEATSASLNALVEAITEENQFSTRETLVFSDGVIQERGFFDLRLDFTTHIAGEARVKVDDPLDIIIHPDGKEYDPDTWPGVIETRLYSLDDIELEFGPKKRVELEKFASNGDHHKDDSMAFTKINTFGGATNMPFFGNNQSMAQSRAIKTVRVVSRQYFRIQQAWHFVDPKMGDMKVAPAKWSDRKIQAFAAKNQLQLIKKAARRVRWTVSADHVLLHDDWSPYRHFTKVPYFCYFRRGKPFGVMTNLISPQDNVNKLASQTLSVVNSTANSGWIVEEDSLIDMEIEELETKGASTGLVLQYAKGSTAPEKIQSNTIPTGLVQMKSEAAGMMDDISGVDQVLEGTASPEFSGIALGQQESRGIRKLSIAIDNLRQTRWLLVRNLLDLVQDHYKEQRIVFIRDRERSDHNMEEVVINERDAAGRIVNDISIGDYDIVIGTRPARDTFEERQFTEVLELRNAGVNIPDHWVVRYSSLENKQQLEDMLAQAAGFGEMSEEEQRAAQLEIELSMVMQEGEVKKLEAEIEDIEARANLSNAKAEDLRAGDDSQALRQQRLGAEAKLAQSKKELDLRRELSAAVNAVSVRKNDQTAVNQSTKIVADHDAKQQPNQNQR